MPVARSSDEILVRPSHGHRIQLSVIFIFQRFSMLLNSDSVRYWLLRTNELPITNKPTVDITFRGTLPGNVFRAASTRTERGILKRKVYTLH